MSENVPQENVCERCGGYKTVYYQITPIYTYDGTPIAHAITNNTMKICICPPLYHDIVK